LRRGRDTGKGTRREGGVEGGKGGRERGGEEEREKRGCVFPDFI